VDELADELPVTRSAASQHLKLLKSAGLPTDRPIGTRRIYSDDPAALAVIREYFDSFWTASMSAFRAAAEQPEQETTDDAHSRHLREHRDRRGRSERAAPSTGPSERTRRPPNCAEDFRQKALKVTVVGKTTGGRSARGRRGRR
jgi:DNA-binding transcriptional ArsR family regulator